VRFRNTFLKKSLAAKQVIWLSKSEGVSYIWKLQSRLLGEKNSSYVQLISNLYCSLSIFCSLSILLPLGSYISIGMVFSNITSGPFEM
jgi:hypothetical protein